MQLGDSAKKSFMYAMRMSVMLLEPVSQWGLDVVWNHCQFPALADLL